MSYNKVKSLTDNVTAIETALAIREQGRTATDTEKEALSRYSGFGGIKDVLNIGTDKPFADDVAEPLNHLQDVLRKHAKGDDALYNTMIESIKSSVLTAFYTPSFLIETVANQIQDTFTANKLPMRTFLEPSAGTGGFLPVAMNGTHAYAFEKDHITGLILSLLNHHKDGATPVLLSIGEATAQETGRELHRISKTYRGKALNIIGSYADMNLSVRSEYDFSGKFERNMFFVEGVSGLKYQCGISGALPLGYVDAALYPQTTLANIPAMIERNNKSIAKLESELPVLEEMLNRQWSKTEELAEFKAECAALQKKIEADLKEVETPQPVMVTEDVTVPDAAA